MSVSPSGKPIVYLPAQANTGGEYTIHFGKVARARPVYIRRKQLFVLPGHTELFTSDPLAATSPEK
jgi:hypothetical protein